MSLEERVTDLEEEPQELKKPKVECIFCHEPQYGQKTSECRIVSFEFFKQVLKKEGVTCCNHDELREQTVWFADFVYGSLLHEMISNHNRDQSKLEVCRKVLSDYSIMEKAFDRFLIEKTELLQRVYDHCEPENKEYWEYRKSLLPIFCKYAKTLY